MSGQLPKAEKDYSEETTALLAKVDVDAKTDLKGAVDQLLALEKQTRLASDLSSTTRILIKIVTLYKETGNWNLMNEVVPLLVKKHGQLKQATTKLVQTVSDFLPATPNEAIKLEVIGVLRTVTEGRIFVEVERARVTRILSDIKLKNGDVKGAAEVLCELQVETFGSMVRREKTEFILEQISLCIQNNDWQQATVLSRKINVRYFARPPKRTPEEQEKLQKEREEQEKNRSADDPPVEPEDDVSDLKLRFYELQIQIAKHDSRYLDICKHYRQILDTEVVEKDTEKLRYCLSRIIYFIVLAPHDNEQSDLLHRILDDSRNAQLPEDASLLELFTKWELMPWPEVESQYSVHLTRGDVFSSAPDTKDPMAYQRWQDLRKRVIEHNVRVIARYYTRISVSRLEQLLNLKADETEQYISDLVTAKTIYARIDRPAGIVSFAKSRDVDDLLNEWGSDVKSLLTLLERVDHLITKEEMMAQLPAKDKVSGQDL